MCSRTALCLHSDGPEQLGLGALTATLRELEFVARTDQNVIAVGLAMDALHRVASGAAAHAEEVAAEKLAVGFAVRARGACEAAAAAAPVLNWESLCRSPAGEASLGRAVS